MPGHSKARQQCLARQYNGHDALPADCKFPWQIIGRRLRIWTSDPSLLGVAQHAQREYHSILCFRFASVRLCTGLEQLVPAAPGFRRCYFPSGSSVVPPMRFVKYFKGGADADGAGHFDADNVCSIALLKNGPTRSHRRPYEFGESEAVSQTFHLVKYGFASRCTLLV